MIGSHDNKGSPKNQVQAENQPKTASESIPTHFPPSPPTFPKPVGKNGKKYFMTIQVAKILGVDRKTVDYWRKQGLFVEDAISHTGAFLYEEERVMQLKAVYHREWIYGGYGITHVKEEELMNISQSTIDDIKKLSGEDLTTIGALHRVGDKANEYICPFCNNGGNGNRDATGIKPLETNTHTGWKCQRCGEKFDNIGILAIHYGLNPKYDFQEICKRACSDFNISYVEEYFSGNAKETTNSATTTIHHSELGIILQQLATSETGLKIFLDAQGGSWRGLPFELLKKKGCRFIKDWLPPSLLAKRPDAKNWATTSPRMLIPASTDSNKANYLARLTVSIENFNAQKRKYIREKDHAGTKTLFNTELLTQAELVIAVEGYVDAMSLEFAGFSAVAFGSAEGYDLLVKALRPLETKPRILILLDPDKTGRTHAPKLQRALKKVGCMSVIRFLSDNSNSKLDANQILVEHGKEKLHEIINNLISDAQTEFTAFEKKSCSPSDEETTAPNDNLALSAEQCDILFAEGSNALANARRLEYLFGDRLRYLQDTDRWLTYSAGLWNRAPKSQNACLYPFVVKAAEILKANAVDEDENKIAASFRGKNIQYSFNFLKGLDSVIITQKDLDNHPELLNCLNGVIDLQTGKLMSAAPELLLTQQCAAIYTGEHNPIVEKFLHDILPDEETLAALIRWLGYCLTGEVSEEKAFLFYGSGGNGKGTLTLLLMTLFYAYATSLPVTAVCEAGRMSDAGAATTELNQLEKKRLAIVEELPQGRKLDTAKFKLLTGGDKIPIRRLHEEYTMIDPTHKIVISGNYRPELTDARDPGLIRRIQGVDFLQHFTDSNRDPHLKKKLLAADALSGLLTLLVDAAKAWYQYGLLFSKAMETSTRNYFAQNDFLSEFISEFCEHGEGRFIEINAFVKLLKEEYPAETRIISDRNLKEMIKRLHGNNGITYKRHSQSRRFGLDGIGFRDGTVQ